MFENCKNVKSKGTLATPTFGAIPFYEMTREAQMEPAAKESGKAAPLGEGDGAHE